MPPTLENSQLQPVWGMRPQSPVPTQLGTVDLTSGVGVTAYTATADRASHHAVSLVEACQWLIEGHAVDYPLVFVGPCLRRTDTATEVGDRQREHSYATGPLTAG
jgi:hypothetical protein